MGLISDTHKASVLLSPLQAVTLFLLWVSLCVFTILWRDPASEQLMLALGRLSLRCYHRPTRPPPIIHLFRPKMGGVTQEASSASCLWDDHNTVTLSPHCFPSVPSMPCPSVWNEACHQWFNVCFMVHVAPGSVSMEKVHYCERFIEFMIDLEVRFHTSIRSATLFHSSRYLFWWY